MEHYTLKVEKTAHYYTLGEVTEKTKYLWFVTHGYGQLASSILRKFEGLDTAENVIVAPEGLNRFYWDFKKGIVGASWMTKQDRLDEIEDYSRFLSLVFDDFKSKISGDCKVILFGFSQGCATQIRWILRGSPEFRHLILWGGMLPEDIDYQPFTHLFKDKKIDFVCGDEDEFINLEQINWHLDFAQKQGLKINHIPFKGKHEILTDVLELIIDN